ncbi:uncharacterized protein FOMMEDRAFT_160630 [Fomitiporia mediterranea MF3/22]|uniref:uncharacterized protein n=1 Tax=Fomitiporia mediterranea (strain MF3/22) TaxID=694068 RepID=UPI0004408DE2|nr:uncharacterized protein FOMMEDRAFT_160630 [Fomitiporia mediterranea MF3/22]EJC99558.1 hypothetical protein FOMMEDRAFT_160630 [Fomitiporia mediterranea MF3/22]
MAAEYVNGALGIGRVDWTFGGVYQRDIGFSSFLTDSYAAEERDYVEIEEHRGLKDVANAGEGQRRKDVLKRGIWILDTMRSEFAAHSRSSRSSYLNHSNALVDSKKMRLLVPRGSWLREVAVDQHQHSICWISLVLELSVCSASGCEVPSFSLPGVESQVGE